MENVMTRTAERFCLTCNKLLRGRSDKKFCDDYCRNTFNNHLKSSTNNLVRNINHALTKNRRILESLLINGENMTKAPREKLQQLGFQFRYQTHSFLNSSGKLCTCCYDHGYLPLENDWFLVVKEKESGAEPTQSLI